MLVSIIVPNFNHASFLEKRLESIFNQTHQNFEVILLDDASTDGSIAILNKFKEHPKVSHFIINSKNSGGPFYQWKKGIELAKGELIWIAESDDYCKEIFLEENLKKFTQNIGLNYVQSTDVDEKGMFLLNRIEYTKEFNPNIWEDNFEMESDTFIKEYLLFKNVIPNASAVVFRKSLVKNTVFDHQLLQMNMCGDWFFWIKILNNTKISFISTPLNFFRNHDTITRKQDSIEKRKKRLIEENTIRFYTNNVYNYSSKLMQNSIYKKWFKMHKASSIVKKDFFEIEHTFYQKMILGFNFLKYKLTN